MFSPITRKIHALLPAAVAIAAGINVCQAQSALSNYLEQPCQRAPGFEPTAVDSIFADKALSPIEGVWRVTGEETLFAVVADPGTIFYRIIVVDATNRTLLPGTLMGAATATAQKNSFDALIYSHCSDGALSKPKRFTLTIHDNCRMVTAPVTDKLRVNLWRLIPYMYRFSVSRVNNRPDNLDGALRIFPSDSKARTAPRYL